MFWAWLVGAAVTVILEMLSGGMYLLSLAIGCTGAALLALLLPRLYWAQLMAFSGLGALVLVYLRPILADHLELAHPRRNAFRLLGMTGVVEMAIAPDKPGTVRVEEDIWPATASTALAPQTPVVVSRVDEHILHVESK